MRTNYYCSGENSLSFSIGMRVSLLFVLTKTVSMMQISIVTRLCDVICPCILADGQQLLQWVVKFNRTSLPDLTLPARPALCSADAWDIGTTTNDSVGRENIRYRTLNTQLRLNMKHATSTFKIYCTINL